uniref:Uncharacterized protein n=1 Tax=Stomoxys calcitrans TaxID=35570 RepID=A0A1I8Q6C0_STOCA
MLLIKLIIVSVFCLLSFTCNVKGEKTQLAKATEEASNRKDTPSTPLVGAVTAVAGTTTTQSNIYRIKRLNLSKDKPKLRKQQRIIEGHGEYLESQQQHLSQTTPLRDRSNIHYMDEAKDMQQHQQDMQQHTRLSNKAKVKKVKNMGKNSHGLNKKLLNKLGFTKVKAPNSHNRKRLAVESRRHASPDDSHMFIIKLPPNMYYYTNPKASSGSGSPNAITSSLSSSSSLGPSSVDLKSSLKLQQQEQSTQSEDGSNKDANGKKVSFPFNSNGKPGRIYHWNLPVIKKMLEEKQQRFPSVAHVEPHKVQQLIDIHQIPTWSKPWENESIEKSYHHDSMMSYKKSLKRKSPSYYAPANTVNKNSFNKYFSGNGKPKGFYVIKENQKKPSYYKNIVA